MQAKLTLRLDDKLIAEAKDHARRQGKSLSMMVADYFQSFSTDSTESVHLSDLPPATRALHGLLKSSSVDEADYHRHLEQKHG